MRCSPPCVQQLCLSNRGDISPNLPCDSASEGRAVFFYLSNSWRFLCSSDTKPVLFASADAGEWSALGSDIGKPCPLTSAQEPKPASNRPIGQERNHPLNSERNHHANLHRIPCLRQAQGLSTHASDHVLRSHQSRHQPHRTRRQPQSNLRRTP